MVHRNQFQSDYRNSTWQENLRPAAPFVLVGAVLFLAYAYTSMTNPEVGLFPAIGGVRARRR